MKRISCFAFIASLFFVSQLHAEDPTYVYALKDMDVQRWQDSATPSSGSVKFNDKLEVIFQSDNWYRVRLPNSPKFGWIPQALVTKTAPPSVSEPVVLDPSMPKPFGENALSLPKKPVISNTSPISDIPKPKVELKTKAIDSTKDKASEQK